MNDSKKTTVTITITDIDLPGNIGIHVVSSPEHIPGEKMTPAQILCMEMMKHANKICNGTYQKI
jgi:hypothetical protein